MSDAQNPLEEIVTEEHLERLREINDRLGLGLLPYVVRFTPEGPLRHGIRIVKREDVDRLLTLLEGGTIRHERDLDPGGTP